MNKLNWTRGLTRLYLLGVVAWLFYWFIWIPLENVDTWQSLAQSVVFNDPKKYREYIARANLLAQMGDMLREVVRTPFASFLLLVVPPIAGYGLLRLIIFTIRWVAGGFRGDRPSAAS